MVTKSRSLNDQGDLIRVIARAVDVIDCLGDSRRGLGITEVSRATGLSKSTVHNLLDSLVKLNLANVDPVSKRYSVGPKPLQWATSFLESTVIAEVAQPYLERLRDMTGETAHLHIRKGFQRTCIAQVLSRHNLRRSLVLGELRPLWSAATGRVLMTGLDPHAVKRYLNSVTRKPLTLHTVTGVNDIMRRVDAVRQSGYELAFEETELGVGAASAAIRDHMRVTIAAATVSGPTSRWDQQRIRKLLPEMVQGANEVSRRLGWDGAGPG